MNTLFRSSSGGIDLDASGGGINMDFNECVFQLSDSYALPLKSKNVGFVFKQKTTCETTPKLLYFDLSYNAAMPLAPRQTSYKFVRFRVLKTRDPAAAYFHLGKLQLYTTGDALVDLAGATLSSLSSAPGSFPANDINNLKDLTNYLRYWNDRNRMPIILSLPTAMPLVGFSFITAPDFLPGAPGPASTTYDPIQWIVEGSMNGYIWDRLHTQRTDYALTTTRVATTPLFYFNGTTPRVLTQPVSSLGTRLRGLEELTGFWRTQMQSAIRNWLRAVPGTNVQTAQRGSYVFEASTNSYLMYFWMDSWMDRYGIDQWNGHVKMTFSPVTVSTDIPTVISVTNIPQTLITSDPNRSSYSFALNGNKMRI
jgi:hypothetical protein